MREDIKTVYVAMGCLLYTSDASDDSLRVDLCGRRIIKKRLSVMRAHRGHR